MPAILRKSLPNYDPSLSIIGSYAVVGAIAVGLGVRVVGPHRAVYPGRSPSLRTL